MLQALKDAESTLYKIKEETASLKEIESDDEEDSTQSEEAKKTEKAGYTYYSSDSSNSGNNESSNGEDSGDIGIINPEETANGNNALQSTNTNETNGSGRRDDIVLPMTD